jgi:hypothetical protein
VERGFDRERRRRGFKENQHRKIAGRLKNGAETEWFPRRAVCKGKRPAFRAVFCWVGFYRRPNHNISEDALQSDKWMMSGKDKCSSSPRKAGLKNGADGKKGSFFPKILKTSPPAFKNAT